MDKQVVVERLKVIADNTKDLSTNRELLELIADIETGAYLPPLIQKKQLSPKPYILKAISIPKSLI